MESLSFETVTFFRTPHFTTDKSLTNPAADTDTEEDPQEFQQIVCRQCGHRITSTEHTMVINGAHQHSFANPLGLIFDIGCFQSAPGCRHSGPITAEYSWFRGFDWHVALCGNCLVQVGWQFVSSTGVNRFYGLILDRLRFPEP